VYTCVRKLYVLSSCLHIAPNRHLYIIFYENLEVSFFTGHIRALAEVVKVASVASSLFRHS